MNSNQNSIISLLQPTPPVEHASSSKSNHSGSADFKNILEEATNNVKRADETTSARQDSQNNFSQSDSQGKPSSVTADKTQDASQARNNNDDAKSDDKSFDSSMNSANAQAANDPANAGTDAATPAATAGTPDDSEALLAERLKTLGMDDEKIKMFLDLFKTDDNNVSLDQIIAALSQQMNPNQANPLRDILSGTQDIKDLIESLQARADAATELLCQAGMDDQEAKNLMGKLIQSKTDQTKDQGTEQTADPTDTTQISDATDGLFAKLADKKSQVTEAKPGDKLDEVTPRMDVKLQVEDKLQKTSERKTDEESDDSADPFRFRDPLSKIANPVQVQLNPADDADAKTVLLNLQNLNDKTGPLQQATVKFQVENAVQGVSQVAETGVKAQAAETLAKELPILPRNVSEKSLVEQIVQKFSVSGNGDRNEISIRLDPPSLGTVRMNISTSGDSVRTTIIAENQAVRQVIENNLSQLKDSISGQGLKVENLQVMVGGESGFKDQSQQQSSRNFGGGPNRDEKYSQKNGDALIQGVTARSSRATRAGGFSLIV